MKRIISVCLVLIMLLTAIPIAAMALSQYGYVTGGWLRLRSGPSFDSSTVGSYYTGTQVKVVGTSGNWYQVETLDGKTGYMYASYISFSGGGTGSAYVTSSNGYGVRMRSGPGTGYAITGVYSVGTAVTILESGTSWSKIQIGSRVGYMMNKFLTTSGGGGGTGDTATIWSANGYGVRLRSGPGTNYSIIGVYSVGTTVTIHSYGTTWDYVSVGSRSGYMMNEYLTRSSGSYVTAFSFGTTAATVTVTSAGANLDVVPTILGTNLTSPYFTLAVSSNASSYVTATRNATTGNILISVGSTIPDNTVFTVTGTTINNGTGGSPLTATITVTVAKTGTLSSITLTPASTTINQNGSTTISARLVYSNGSYVNNAPTSLYTASITSGDSYATLVTPTLSGKAFSGTSDQTVTIRGVATENTAITGTCTVTVRALNKPGAATLVSAVGQSSQVRLTWAAPTDNGGSDVLGYKLYQSTTSTMGSSPITTITPGSVLTATIGSLTNGTTYYYWVVAYNAQGDGTVSNMLSATPNASVPDAPTALAVTSTSSGTINLSWTAPYNGGSAILEYRIYYGGTTYAVSSTTTASLTGLTNGTSYSIYVTAHNILGDSAASNTVSGTPATAPSAPSGVTATGSLGKATLSWPIPASNGSTINGYRVEYSTDNTFPGGSTSTATTTSAGCEISITTGGVWYFRVTTTSVAHGNSPTTSETVSATVLEQVQTPTFSPATATTATVSQTITISCATSSASIYYTTDGTTPTTSSTSGTSATLTQTGIVKAIAVKSGMVDSAVATSPTYTIKAVTPTGTSGGTVASGTVVTLSSSESGATIHYTTDGVTNPTESSTLYASPGITLTNTGTADITVQIRAVAIRSNCDPSDILTINFTVNPAP